MTVDPRDLRGVRADDVVVVARTPTGTEAPLGRWSPSAQTILPLGGTQRDLREMLGEIQTDQLRQRVPLLTDIGDLAFNTVGDQRCIDD